MEREKISAVVLAGGFGVRTQNVLGHLPKALIETSDGRTIIDHELSDLIAILKKDRVKVVTNGKFFDVINEEVSKNEELKGISILNDNAMEPEKRLGALGDLIFVLNSDEMKDSDGYLLVLPSDTAYWKSFSIKDFIQYGVGKDGFVMAVREVDDPGIIANRFGCVVIDKDGRIVDFEEKPEKPKSNYAASPFYMYKLKEYKELLEKYKEQGGNMDSPGNLVPFAIKHCKFYAFIVRNQIVDAGTSPDISEAHKY